MKVTYTPTGDRKATVTDKTKLGRQTIDALRHDNMLAVGHYPHAKITVHEVVDDE